jgi:phosphoheptose isomerase
MYSQIDKKSRAKTHLLESAEIKHRVAEECIEPIVNAAQLIAESFKAGCRLLLCGNGGSAADCQHIAAEFVGTLTQDFKRPGLKAIALTTDTSLLTAYSNDYGFEGVFARQVETLGDPGDVLIAISTSGNSKNIILAVEAARNLKIGTIGLTGSGGRLLGITDIAISVPSKNTQHIQEAHITIGHILCDLVECDFFNSK